MSYRAPLMMQASIRAAAVPAPAWPLPGAAADSRFSYQGLPPLRAGSTLAQAERQPGAPLLAVTSVAGDAQRCRRCGLTQWPGTTVIVDDGVLSRVETRGTRYASIGGVPVGDDVAKAQRVYGQRSSVAPHLYFPKGLMPAVASSGRSDALVIEGNDAGRNVTWRAGAVPAVERPEGCSR